MFTTTNSDWRIEKLYINDANSINGNITGDFSRPHPFIKITPLFLYVLVFRCVAFHACLLCLVLSALAVAPREQL